MKGRQKVGKICKEEWYGWNLPPVYSASGRRESEWMGNWNWKALDT